MKDFTGIFHIDTLYDSQGKPTYKAFENLQKIKDTVQLTVLTDVKEDLTLGSECRVHKDYPGLFQHVLPVHDLKFIRPMPSMSLGTFYFGSGMELLLTCKLFEIRTVWYYSQQHCGE